MQDDKKRKKLVLIISMIGMILVFVGIAYAYYVAKITGSESTSTISLQAGSLSLVLDGGNNLTASGFLPDNDNPWITKTFTVTGNNTMDDLQLPYIIKIVIDQNTFTTANMLYSINGENISNNGKLAFKVEKGIVNASGTTTIGNGYFTSGSNMVHSYSLSLYFPETDTDQSADMHAQFKCHIIIDGDRATPPEPKGWSSAQPGTLLGAIKDNNPIADNAWTVPGRQVSKYGNMTVISVTSEEAAYYWTYGDDYSISSNQFSLIDATTCVYSSCYASLVGNYMVSNTVADNSSSTNITKAYNNLTNIYKVIYASPTQIKLEKYSVLAVSDTASTYKYWTYGTGAESASTNATAKYNLTGVEKIVYDTNYQKLEGKYIYGSSETATSLSSIAASSESTTKTTTNLGYFHQVVRAEPTYIVYKSAVEGGLGQTSDDYGTSYYYRGLVENNYLIFANMCWRIVRIDGNGSVKVVLYNYNSGSVSNPCASAYDSTTAAYARYNGTSYASAFNTNKDNNAYIGFMYGTPGSSTYDEEHKNINKSTILGRLEQWYTSKLESKESVLADTVWCNDKSLFDGSQNVGFGNIATTYAAYKRITPLASATPTLVCPDSNGTDKNLSRMTVEKGIGNGALDKKIGLLTIDEVSFAGVLSGFNNETFYLYNNALEESWWTMSPSSFVNDSSTYPAIVRIRLGRPYLNTGTATNRIRPAIALKSDVTISGGNGTQSNPFIVN